MLNDISMQAKLLLALGALLFISAGTGVYIYTTIKTLEGVLLSVESAVHAEVASAALKENLMGSLEDLVEFVAFGDLSKKEAYEAKNLSFDEAFGKAKDAISRVDPDLVARIETIQKTRKAWEDNIVKKQLEYMRSPFTVDLARLYQSSEENRGYWKEILAELDAVSHGIALVVEESVKAEHKLMEATTFAVTFASMLTLIGCIAAIIFLVKTVSQPLQVLVRVTSDLIKKNWSVEISGSERKDEIGLMARALMQFRDNGIENDRLQAAQSEENQKRLERAQRIEELVKVFEQDTSQTTMALDDATSQMQKASLAMSSVASQASDLSSQVAASAREAGVNVQQVAAASEELTASINEISMQLSHTSQKAVHAKEAALGAVEKMKSLTSAANEIGNVVQIITDIAEQTNLLALNATIESARAGEAGKGFAVVANEVKGLAGQTANATDQIRAQVQAMQAETREAVSMIENISHVIEDLNMASSSIASAMEEQSSATQEISRNVNEAAQGTSNVVRNINDVSQSVEVVGHTSGDVNTVSEELAKRSEVLKKDVQHFIKNIRAA